MELFQRVKQVSKELAKSETKLASMLDLPQRTLNGYLNEKSQRNLWEYLPKILELFPQIRREWLWWGEGSMLKGDLASGKVSYIEKSAPEPEPITDDRVERLEHKNVELTVEAKNELLASKDKIIALHEENKRLVESVSAVVTPTETRRDNPQHATSDRPASGVTDCGV